MFSLLLSKDSVKDWQNSLVGKVICSENLATQVHFLKPT